MRIVTHDDQRGRPTGFTLLELMLVIVIIALVTVAMAYIVRSGLAALRTMQATQLVDNTKVAIESMRVASGYGRYPCPADPALLPGDANYGRENCSIGAAGSLDVPGTRTAAERVLVGILPIYVFNTATGNWESFSQFFDKRKTFMQDGFNDPWGNPLRYVVTANLARPSSYPLGDVNGWGLGVAFNSANGQIRVVDETGGVADLTRDTGGTASNAHFVVYSTGARDFADCNALGGGTMESANCETPADATFRYALSNATANDANYFDDIMSFGLIIENRHWTSDVDLARTTTFLSPAAPFRNLGINTTTPREMVEVNGHISAHTTRALLLCNTGTGAARKCVALNNLRSLSCSPPNYMRGLTFSSTGAISINCRTIPHVPGVIGTGADLTCASGRLRGYYSDGTPSCI